MSDNPSELLLETGSQGSCRVLKAAGRVDFSTVPQFQDTLMEEAGEVAAGNGLIVDLGGLDLITSAGLRVLMQTKKKLSGEGAKLVVTGVDGTVADVFRVSRFDTLLTLKPTIEDGLAGFAGGA